MTGIDVSDQVLSLKPSHENPLSADQSAINQLGISYVVTVLFVYFLICLNVFCWISRHGTMLFLKDKSAGANSTVGSTAATSSNISSAKNANETNTTLRYVY